MKFIVPLNIFFLLTQLLPGCSARPSEYSDTKLMMGTFVTVKVIVPDSNSASRASVKEAVDGAFALAVSLEKKFNIFDPESEVTRLNINKLLNVSPDMKELLLGAVAASELTKGEFDITVAPILKANGFYKNMPKNLSDKILDSTGGVGWRNVLIDTDTGTVKLLNNAWIDLSGVAGGYIVDRMAAYLKEKGFVNIMINDGGDIYCGTKPDAGFWRVGIRSPSEKQTVMILNLSGKAVTTSGDYENTVLDRTSRGTLSHIASTETLSVKTKKPSSVTVIAPNCLAADALATGMMAMGAEKALALADTLEDTEIITIDTLGGKEVIAYSKNASEYAEKRQRNHICAP